MTAVLALALLASSQAAGSATFSDVWDRWKRVDAAWSVVGAKPHRETAIPHLKSAANHLFGSRWPDACRDLDDALAALQGQVASAERAVNLRFLPPVAEPGKPAKLSVTWAYRPADRRSVRLQIGNREVMLTPGRPLVLDVQPIRHEPELNRTPELGVLVTAKVGNSTRSVHLSILKSARARIGALLKSPEEAVRHLGAKALAMMERGVPDEPSLSVIGAVTLGESLVKGRAKLSELTQVPYGRLGTTSLQASLPPGPSQGKVTVVVGVSGYGGESAFFDSFGQGAAPAEALKRGWAFVGASSTETAVSDALDWVQSKLGRRADRWYVMGYSRAAAEALSAAALSPKPAAIALLAPSAASVPKSWTSGPIFLAVGKQDATRVVLPVQGMYRELQDRKDVRLFEAEPCEHLMLPNEAIREAFAFFDAHAGG